MAVALLLAPRALLLAQFHDVTVPADSYLWWTLSEEVTPEELKRLHSDRSLSLERYDAAVEAGLEKPLSPEQRKRLKFYIHQQLTSELVPMWAAFDIFARSRISRRGVPEEVVPRELAEYGISSPGVETIMAAARTCAAAYEELMAELGPKQIEAQLLIQHRLEDERAGIAPRGKPILEAIKDRDYEFVASVVGRPTAEIRELVDALAVWGRPGGASELVARCLPVLKDGLSVADWRQFQRYLREVIVSPLGGLAFFDETAQEGRR